MVEKSTQKIARKGMNLRPRRTTQTTKSNIVETGDVVMEDN